MVMGIIAIDLGHAQTTNKQISIIPTVDREIPQLDSYTGGRLDLMTLGMQLIKTICTTRLCRIIAMLKNYCIFSFCHQFIHGLIDARFFRSGKSDFSSTLQKV